MLKFTFLANKKGTPSIETVALIAFIALAIFGAMQTVGADISSVFTSVSNELKTAITP
ncbi:MAG: Flp family type IVb pilin [Thermoanaerobacteraceae bacterium]|nr:Flp family type IVb pilin [Thermoanaerobacteraceae bacterium]